MGLFGGKKKTILEKYEKRLNELKKANFEEKEVIEILISELSQKGKFGESVELMNEVYDFNNPYQLFNKAVTLEQWGKSLPDMNIIDESMACFLKMIEMVPRSVQAYYKLGRIQTDIASPDFKHNGNRLEMFRSGRNCFETIMSLENQSTGFFQLAFVFRWFNMYQHYELLHNSTLSYDSADAAVKESNELKISLEKDVEGIRKILERVLQKESPQKIPKLAAHLQKNSEKIISTLHPK